MRQICANIALVYLSTVDAVKRGSVILPQTVIEDIAVVPPYPDTVLASHFPTPPSINVPGFQRPYFKPAQNLPQVNVDDMPAATSK